MITLCLDFGNTRYKVAVFDNDTLKEVVILNDNTIEHLRSIVEIKKPQRSILSSVVNHPEEVEDLLKQNTGFHKLNSESKLPFIIPVGRPETVGADRLAIAAASVFLF